MHICQDEVLAFMLAIQNGPANLFRYLATWFHAWLAAGGWIEDDMRAWRQARKDMQLLTKDKTKMVWVRAEEVAL